MGLVRVVAKPGGGWMAGEPKPAYATVRSLIAGKTVATGKTRNCALEAKSGTVAPLAESQIRYSYCLVLGRTADGAGAAVWAARLQAGQVSVQDLLINLFRSDEFRTRYRSFALSDADFVNLLFGLLLDRDADGGGMATYSGTDSRGKRHPDGRGALAYQFERVQEEASAFVREERSRGCCSGGPAGARPGRGAMIPRQPIRRVGSPQRAPWRRAGMLLAAVASWTFLVGPARAYHL